MILSIEKKYISKTPNLMIKGNMPIEAPNSYPKRKPAGGEAPPTNFPPATSGRGDYHERPSPMKPIDCSLFAPPKAQQNSTFMVQVFVHPEKDSGLISMMAVQFDSDSLPRGVSSLGTRLSSGMKLDFELIMNGLNVKPQTRSLTWIDKAESVRFIVEVPAGQPAGPVIGQLIIIQESVPIGDIFFKLTVTKGTKLIQKESTPRGMATRYSSAFISYARKDSHEVLQRVQMLSAAGIKFRQDILDLDPGDIWEPKLYNWIDKSDIMFLFWSTAARESEWVRKEWTYALKNKGPHYIRPVIIEGPPPPNPPAELSHLHFSDKILYFMKK